MVIPKLLRVQMEDSQFWQKKDFADFFSENAFIELVPIRSLESVE